MSGTNVERAAHVDHTIEHSHTDLGNFIGLGLGIVAGIAIVATGGLAAVLVLGPLACGVAVAGGDIGAWVGGQLPTRKDSGHIARGSPTVFYGPEAKPAARMRDRTACYSPGMPTMERITPLLGAVFPIFAGMSLLSGIRGINRAITIHFEMPADGIPAIPEDGQPGAHAGSYIADGSETCFIETWPAARETDGVYPCDGKISSGIDSIRIGGPRCRMAGTEERSEIDRGQRITQRTIDIVGKLLDYKNPGAILSLAGDFLGLFNEDLGRFVSGVGTLVDIRRFGRQDPNRPFALLDDINSGFGIFQGGVRAREGSAPRPTAPNSFDPVTRTVGPPIDPRPPFAPGA